MFRFRPEDFSSTPGNQCSEILSDHCNRLLDDHVASLPEVFRCGSEWCYEVNVLVKTYRARLWNIEKIEPKNKCEHPSVATLIHNEHSDKAVVSYRCNSCHRWLKPEWKEAE